MESEEWNQPEFKEVGSFITKTCLYSFDPLKSYFYTIKLGLKGVYIIFLISSTSTRNLRFEQKYKHYQELFFFYLKIFSFWRWNFLYI